MRRDRDAAHAAHILDHTIDFPTKRIRRLWQAQGDYMPSIRADLESVDTEHTVTVDRSVRTPSAIAVVGEDHKLQPRPASRRRDLVDSAGSVRSLGVNVDCPAHRIHVSGRFRRG